VNKKKISCLKACQPESGLKYSITPMGLKKTSRQKKKMGIPKKTHRPPEGGFGKKFNK